MGVRNPAITRCSCRRPETCVERHRGRYLATVFEVTLERDGRVRTGEVSDRLGVSPASVTGIFERLAAEDLLEYEKHRGVELTRRGREIAGELTRRQHLLRRFFRVEPDAAVPAKVAYRTGFVVPRDGIERLRTRFERGATGCRCADDRKPIRSPLECHRADR